MEMEDHPVAVSLERAVEVAPQHLAVQEADRDLAGRGLGSQVRISRQLDPLHRLSGIQAVSLFSSPPASSTSTRKSGSSKSRSRATPSRVSSSKKRTTTLAMPSPT